MTEAQSEYVIVKREPTIAMSMSIPFPTNVTPNIGHDVWRAMLSASPRPETVLTDAEIDAVVREQWGAGVNIPAAHRAVARAVESAIMKKLVAA